MRFSLSPPLAEPVTPAVAARTVALRRGLGAGHPVRCSSLLRGAVLATRASRGLGRRRQFRACASCVATADLVGSPRRRVHPFRFRPLGGKGFRFRMDRRQRLQQRRDEPLVPARARVRPAYWLLRPKPDAFCGRRRNHEHPRIALGFAALHEGIAASR